MFFSRIYDRKLAQASYLLGCQVTGEALVVDPNRDLAQYAAAAAAEKLRIRYVTETHIHADFVSGARALAAEHGAELLLSAAGGVDWQYAFAKSSHARLLLDGDSFDVGRVRIAVLHTPGHTPEHLSFLVTDTVASPHPLLLLTGDFVFVGDVGRPDLLEKAAKQLNTMEAGGRTLWRSLARFRALPDHVQVWPGHGAGSACGKSLGSVPASTIGYERLANWGLTAGDEDSFVRLVLEGQPEPPAYFARMKRVNRDDPPLAGTPGTPSAVTRPQFERLQREGAVVVDLRAAEAFAAGFVRGAINVPLSGGFTTYAGSAIPYDIPLVLLTPDEDGAHAAEAARDLALIGFDSVAGRAGPSVLEHVPLLETIERVAPEVAIARYARGSRLVDVRNTTEWSLEHVRGAWHLPFPELMARAGELPRDEPLLVQCQTGSRSAIATSILRRLGFTAADAGGIVAWRASGGPVESSPG